MSNNEVFKPVLCVLFDSIGGDSLVTFNTNGMVVIFSLTEMVELFMPDVCVVVDDTNNV